MERSFRLIQFGILTALVMMCAGTAAIAEKSTAEDVTTDTTAFSVTTGECTATESCIMSPNFPSNYNWFDECVIFVQEVGILSVEAFDLDEGYDYLYINDEAFTGSSGPEGVAVTVGDLIQFEALTRGSSGGFKICLLPCPSPAPTATSHPSASLLPTPLPSATTILNVSTFAELRRAAQSIGPTIILITQDIVVKKSLRIDDFRDITLQSAPNSHGHRYTLSGGNTTHVLVVVEGSRVQIHDLSLADGYSASAVEEDSGGLISAVGTDTALQVVDVDFRASRGLSGGAVSCTLGAVCRFNRTSFAGCVGYYGGAVYFDTASPASFFSSVLFSNCRARSVGGAVYARESRITFFETSFESLQAQRNGGAVYASDGAHLNFLKVRFESCASEVGPAVHLYFSESNLRDVDVLSCQALREGGAIYQDSSTSRMSNVTFRDCHSIESTGGALYLSRGSTVIADRTTFEWCSAKLEGGAVYAEYESSFIARREVTFRSCAAASHGGAIALVSSSAANFTNTSFTSNAAGRIIFRGSNSSSSVMNNGNVSDGGSVWARDSDLAFVASSVLYSSATGSGGSIYASGVGALTFQDTNVTNSSADENGGGIFRSSYALQQDKVVLSRCRFLHCSAGSGGGGAAGVAGQITVDVEDSTFESCVAGSAGGALEIASDTTADAPPAMSFIASSTFHSCKAAEKGGALALLGAWTSISDTDFANCEVIAPAPERVCMELTMKTTIPESMWYDKMMVLRPSLSTFFVNETIILPNNCAPYPVDSALSNDQSSDLDCIIPANKWNCFITNYQCLCDCHSKAESLIRNQSTVIFNTTMACADNVKDQKKTFCVDAATDDTSFEILVTNGHQPGAISWTLMGASTSEFLISNGEAGQRRRLLPFADERSATTGYGGGAIFINESAVVDVIRCSFVGTSVGGSYGGGAIYVESEEGSDLTASTTPQTHLSVLSSAFRATSGYLGTALYSSLASVTFNDSWVATDAYTGKASNHFFDADTSALCVSGCPLGTYGNCTTMGSECASCDVGVCLSCPPGRTALEMQAGSTRLEDGCGPCPEGTASSTIGWKKQCDRCQPGTFAVDEKGDSTKSGAVLCKPCEANSYAPLNGSTSCLTCPLPEITSIPGSPWCDVAVEGYYVPDYGTANSVARKCPRHASCPGGLYLPVPKKGYWSDPMASSDRSSSSSSNEIVRIYECIRNTCTGNKGNSSCWIAPGAVGGSKSGGKCHIDDMLCKKGSRGPLCGSCTKRHTYNAVTATCESCKADAPAVIATLVILPFLVALIGFLWLQHLQQLCAAGFLCGCSSTIGKLFLSIDRASVKICWTTFQIVSSIPISSGVDFPEPFATWLQGLSFTSFDFLSSDCIFLNQSYYQKVYITGFLPLAFAVLLLGGCAAWTQLRPESREYIHHRWLPFGLLLLSYCMLPPVTARLFTSLDCISIDGSEYLRSDTAVDCGSSAFKRFSIFVGIFIAAYLCIPLLWAVLIYRVRVQLNPARRDNRTFERDTEPLMFLLADYRQRCEYAECLEIFRRIFFIGALPLISQNADTRCFLGVAFGLLSLIIISETAPFRVQFNNVIARTGQYVIIVTYGSAAAIETGVNHRMKSSIFGLLLLVVNLLLVVLAAYLAIRNFRNRSRGAPLLEGMEQHFFLSHYQLNSGDQCDALEKELRDRTFKVWYDNKADDLTELGMKAGVDKSEVFLLFLNSHTLSRWFVQLELREALRLKKRMVLIRETDGRHGAPLDSDGCFDLRKVFEHNPNDVGAFRQTLVNQQIPDAEIEMQITKKFPPVADDIRALFEVPGLQGKIIPYMRRSPFREAMIATILDQADMSHLSLLEDTSTSPSSQGMPLPPLSTSFTPGSSRIRYHACIACGSNGQLQSCELAALLKERLGMSVAIDNEEQGAASMGVKPFGDDDGGSGGAAIVSGGSNDVVIGRGSRGGFASESHSVAESLILIVFLTDHALEDLDVQEKLRGALHLGRCIVLVYETEKRYGAPLNVAKTFDFARVFDEQAPKDLSKVHHDREGIPYMRCGDGGSDRLVNAMLDAIAKQARSTFLPADESERTPSEHSFMGSVSISSIASIGIRMTTRSKQGTFANDRGLANYFRKGKQQHNTGIKTTSQPNGSSDDEGFHSDDEESLNKHDQLRSPFLPSNNTSAIFGPW